MAKKSKEEEPIMNSQSEDRGRVDRIAAEIMEPALREAVRKADGEAPSIEIMSALANAYGGFLVDLLGRKAAVSLMRGHADHIEKLEDSGITDGKH